MRKIIFISAPGAAGEALRTLLVRYTDVIEPAPPDEVFLDVGACRLFDGSATLIAHDLRRALARDHHIAATIGVAPNKYLAELAARAAGPGGVFVLHAEDVAAFVRDVPVEDVWGVGRLTARKMRELGLRTCADLQATPPWQLRGWFGARAGELTELARGHDERPVEDAGERKSLSVEQTFARDLTTLDDCLAQVPMLHADFAARLAASDLSPRIRGVFVKIKFHDFRTTTCEVPARHAPGPADFTPLITRAWLRREEPVRLMGLGVRLEGTTTDPRPTTDQLSFSL